MVESRSKKTNDFLKLRVLLDIRIRPLKADRLK